MTTFTSHLGDWPISSDTKAQSWRPASHSGHPPVVPWAGGSLVPVASTASSGLLMATREQRELEEAGSPEDTGRTPQGPRHWPTTSNEETGIPLAVPIHQVPAACQELWGGIIKRRPLAPRAGCRDCPYCTEERNRGSDGVKALTLSLSATKWCFEPVSGRPWDTTSSLFRCPQLRMCSWTEMAIGWD